MLFCAGRAPALRPGRGERPCAVGAADARRGAASAVSRRPLPSCRAGGRATCCWCRPPAAADGCWTPPRAGCFTTIRPPANRGRVHPSRCPTAASCSRRTPEPSCMLDPASDREVWTYILPGMTTRTGEAPRLSVGPDAVLLAWATNIGWRVQRLDRATGQPIWADPPLFNVGDLDVDGWSQDADAFYGVAGSRPLRPIAEGRRGVVGTAGGRAGGPLADAAGRRQPVRLSHSRRAARNFNSVGCWGGYNGKVGFPPEEESGRGFPVACHDARTGRLVQRLNFPVAPQSFARLDPDETRRAAGVRRWGTVEGRPLVQLSAHGLVVAAAGRAWGLSAMK